MAINLVRKARSEMPSGAFNPVTEQWAIGPITQGVTHQIYGNVAIGDNTDGQENSFRLNIGNNAVGGLTLARRGGLETHKFTIRNTTSETTELKRFGSTANLGRLNFVCGNTASASSGFGWLTESGTQLGRLEGDGTVSWGVNGSTNIHENYGARWNINAPTLASTQFTFLGVYDATSALAQVGGHFPSGGARAGFLGIARGGGSGFDYLYTDSSQNLRISNSSANIGNAAGTVVGTQTSDERLKANVRPTQYGLNTVLQLAPIDFEMDGIAKVGFGAQTTLPVLPEAVYDTNEVIEEGEPTKLAMDYSTVIPVLVKAVQELKEEFDAYKATHP